MPIDHFVYDVNSVTVTHIVSDLSDLHGHSDILDDVCMTMAVSNSDAAEYISSSSFFRNCTTMNAMHSLAAFSPPIPCTSLSSLSLSVPLRRCTLTYTSTNSPSTRQRQRINFAISISPPTVIPSCQLNDKSTPDQPFVLLTSAVVSALTAVVLYFSWNNGRQQQQQRQIIDCNETGIEAGTRRHVHEFPSPLNTVLAVKLNQLTHLTQMSSSSSLSVPVPIFSSIESPSSVYKQTVQSPSIQSDSIISSPSSPSEKSSPIVSLYTANASILSDLQAPLSSSRRGPSPSPTSSIPFSFTRRPTFMGLFGGLALTSTSLIIRQRQRRNSPYNSSIINEQIIHDACTVLCMHIPFCVSERFTLLQNLDNLINTAGACTDAKSLSKACRNVAHVVEKAAFSGVLEDSTKFAPHVDVFIAQSFKEAERRFSAHVIIEGERMNRLKNSPPLTGGGDYGVITMVIATMEGVDLKCYDEDGGCTNLQKLRSALKAIRRLEEGEVAGLELLWVPQKNDSGAVCGLNTIQMQDAYPNLRIG